MTTNSKNIKKSLPGEEIRCFQRLLMQWHAHHRRDFPWVGEKDPYKVWLSEIILQQTRVEQGLPYYNRFLEHFPTILDLAAGKEQLIFRLWQGLGYYNRCKNLIKTAQIVADAYRGHFPETYEEVIQLPGVGPYTAAAITSFAYDLPYPVVDGNVERFLARYYGIEEPVNTSSGKKRFTSMADQLLDRDHPAHFNQAMMDFGATHCRPKDPLCTSCPFVSTCYAATENKVLSFPVKKKKKKVKKRYLNYVVLCHKDSIYIRKRGAGDIWQNLHDFLLLEKQRNISTKSLQQEEALHQILAGMENRILTSLPVVTHQLTHQKLFIKVFMTSLDEEPSLPKAFFPVSVDALDQYAFPRPLVRFLDKITYWMNNQ